MGNAIWRLQDARNRSGQRILAIVQKPGVPFSLTFAHGRLQLRNSCNFISGEYLIGEQGAFAIDHLQRSTKHCPNQAEMAAEAEIMSVLEKATIIELPNGKAKNRLRIRDAAGRTLSLEAIPLPNSPQNSPKP
ncbi:MAG: META domain-containing protein [Pseudomonadota bacterium]|nr:META domain-containing protein [Pseudomonadota bacterium]